MIKIILFFLTYIALFFSVIGYGLIIARLSKLTLAGDINIGIKPILGIIFLSFISYVTIFFIHFAWIACFLGDSKCQRENLLNKL